MFPRPTFGWHVFHRHLASFSPIRFVHLQASVPLKHYSFALQLPLSCQSRCCLQWSYDGDIEVECFLALQTGLVRMKEKDVKGGLLSNQPFRSHPSHANTLLDAFHQVLGDITAFHKTVVTFTFQLTPLSALHHWLPLSAHSVFQHKVNCTSPPVAAGLSLSACVCVWIHVWLLLMCQGCRHVSMF